MAKILEVRDLCVSVEDKTILENINLTVNSGEIHVLMGPNGAGKSTLMNAIMAHPKYKIDSGSIIFQGEDITEQKADERARKGIFMSFQNPEEIQGVSVEEFLKEALNSQKKDYKGALKFHKELVKKMDELKIDSDYVYVNGEERVRIKGKVKIEQELEIKLKENEYFVMGDNVGRSNDSLYEYSLGNNDFLIKRDTIMYSTEDYPYEK